MESILIIIFLQLIFISFAFKLCPLHRSIKHSKCIMNDDRRLSKDNDDFISNLFAKFLPVPEDVGLKRYDQNSRPENYPAVKDEFAQLLPQDDTDDKKLIRQLLAKTNLEFRPLKLVYNANQDGWNPKVFHSKVDKLGPALVLCKSITGLFAYSVHI